MGEEQTPPRRGFGLWLNEPLMSGSPDGICEGQGMAKYETTRKLVTILCADVAGYSRLMGDDEHATVHTLSAYREVFTTLIVHHKGRLIDTAGDSVLAEFPSVVAAVQCAVEVQTTLHEHNADLPAHRKMWFRIGINLGDVLTKDDGTIYGDSVNIAARLEALADPGGVCIVGSVYDNVQTRLELAYTSLGEQSVKNILQPVRAYQVVRAHNAPTQVIPAPWFQRPGRWAIRVAATMLLVLAIAGVVSWQRFKRSPARPGEVTSQQSRSLALPDNPSLAVLPFKNMSEDAQQDYFSDGFTDTLITDLAQLRQLVVIARNSTFTYKGKAVDVRQVGQELGVRYILEGSVQRAEGRVRINTQLVDAGTGKHLWATRFDRPFDDIFAVQDTITRKIVAALDVELVEGEQARVWRRTTESPEAYDVFLQGREHALRFTKQDTASARALYTQALTLAPKFAAAMSELGWTYLVDADLWGVSPDESWEKMRGAAESAIALDDTLGEGYSVLEAVLKPHER